MGGVWSFSSAKCSWSDQTTGQALLLDTGEVLITLFGLTCSGEPTDLSYTVKIVDCANP